MQKKKAETGNKNAKKANLLDHSSIKHILDESVSEIVKSRGYAEDVRMSDVRLLIGTIIIVIALVAQFYKKKLHEPSCPVVKETVIVSWESITSTGLVVSSKLPRFSDLYTLTIASADPKSISAGKPDELTKSVTLWFTKGGVLAEGLFWKDVKALMNDYAAEPKKKK